MPSDHVIKDEPRFVGAVRKAAEVAATGKLVLFGIAASTPHSGYGYIERGAALAGFDGGFAVAPSRKSPTRRRRRVTSRPAATTGTAASSCWVRVRCSPNWSASSLPFSPRPDARWQAPARDLGFLRLEGQGFASAPSISIDYAVMERTGLAAVVPIDVGWSDVGSWSSLWD